jgi:signal transduction histidine kinase
MTGGIGLGLPYARRPAEALGGGLQPASTPGSGSTATLLEAIGSALGHAHG